MTVSAVIFDLDGTLADTLADIGAALNHALVALGHPPHTLEAYKRFIGEGVELLVERALPPDHQDDRPRVIAAYLERYADHMLDTTVPYPGVPELLDALAARAVPMAVLSNKPDPATRHIMATLFSRWKFDAVAGRRPEVPRKPDPTAALRLADALGRAPADCAFVGDTTIDVATARAAGMLPVGVAWGFHTPEALRAAGAARIVARADELLGLLSARSPA